MIDLENDPQWASNLQPTENLKNQIFILHIFKVINLYRKNRQKQIFMRQWEGRCSLPCKEEQIKLTSQGVSQTQAYQAWVHCVSVDNGEQRSKDNQKTKRQKMYSKSLENLEFEICTWLSLQVYKKAKNWRQLQGNCKLDEPQFSAHSPK